MNDRLWITDKTRDLIDRGALRDKVAARDPAAVPEAADAEAAGTPTDAAVLAVATAAQARYAGAVVPHLDRDRAVGDAQTAGGRATISLLAAIWILAAAAALILGAAATAILF